MLGEMLADVFGFIHGVARFVIFEQRACAESGFERLAETRAIVGDDAGGCVENALR